MLLDRSIESYEMYKNSDQIIFYDRRVADNVAYARCFNLNEKPVLEASKKYPYNKKVFLLCPWEEIYQTDDERKMTFEQICGFHSLICQAYETLGYELAELPFASVQQRADFITKQLHA